MKLLNKEIRDPVLDQARKQTWDKTKSQHRNKFAVHVADEIWKQSMVQVQRPIKNQINEIT